MSAMQVALQQQVERLYTDHHGWLQGWLRRKLGDGCVAADLAQDTFISVIDAGAADQIREPRSFLVLALEAVQQLDQALDGLPPKVKEAFLLAHLHELSYAQIAQRLGGPAARSSNTTRANRQCLFALSA